MDCKLRRNSNIPGEAECSLGGLRKIDSLCHIKRTDTTSANKCEMRVVFDVLKASVLRNHAFGFPSNNFRPECPNIKRSERTITEMVPFKLPSCAPRSRWNICFLHSPQIMLFRLSIQMDFTNYPAIRDLYNPFKMSSRMLYKHFN